MKFFNHPCNQDLFVLGEIIVENEDTIGLLFTFFVEFTVKTKSKIYVLGMVSKIRTRLN